MPHEMVTIHHTDESIHHYGRRYDLILCRVFPGKVTPHSGRWPSNPFRLSEENRALLYQFFEHIEGEAAMSYARRGRVFTLLAVLGEMIGDTPFNVLTREEVKSLVAKVRQQSTWSLTTQNYHLKALKRFLKFLNGDEDYPECISWLKIKERKQSPIRREDLITEEEMSQILVTNKNPMHRCLFAMLWEGLRIGEIGTLKCKNITFEGGETYISVNGKTGERTVMSIGGTPYIRQWLDLHPTQNPDDWLFVIDSNKNKGKRFGYNSIRVIIKKGCEKAGITGRRVHPHLFRHSSITDRRRKGMRQREASSFYGVSGLVMGKVYDHLADTDVRNEVRRVFGLQKIEEEKPKINPKNCPYCQKINPHYSTLCLNCGNPLSTEDALKSRGQFKHLEEENIHIKRELSALRGILTQFTDQMKTMPPERLAQILQASKNEGGNNHE